MKKLSLPLFVLLLYFSACTKSPRLNRDFVILSGEPGQTSVIIQCRFATNDSLLKKGIQGVECEGMVQLSASPKFSNPMTSDMQICSQDNDYLIKHKFKGLDPDTRYHYRALARIPETGEREVSARGSFVTLPGDQSEREVSFAIATGFNYEHFYGMDTTLLRRRNFHPKMMPATGNDSLLGFEAFESIGDLQVDFFIPNGDVVYYDKPSNLPETWATDREGMRAKWHRFFSMVRNQALLSTTPYFFLKDDHDHRFNDCDTTNEKSSEPSSRLGIEVFKEQVPVTDPADPGATTYRTHRAGKHLQLWFVEGRDYRSPNSMEDGPDKSVWGAQQLAWLKKTLLASDATFKLLISPTPLVGPDDAYKKDNHTNLGGFRHEGRAFFQWLDSTGVKDQNFYIICGDRHWQYHSIHPSGIEEFSCGAIIDQNSRAGRVPGDPASTDPKGLIEVPYIQLDNNWGGGFLMVDMSAAGRIPTLDFRYYDKEGNVRYSVLKIPEHEKRSADLESH